MNILGIGTDIIEIERIRTLYHSLQEKNLSKVFTKREIQQCLEKMDPHVHLSGKLAAKEAVIKSIPLERKDGLVLNQIEILSMDDAPPKCVLHGMVKERFIETGGKKILLSISHSENNSVAFSLISG